MLAMSGMRGFSLSERRGRCVSCDPEGVFVGEVPLLQRSHSYGKTTWSLRPAAEINVELTALYRLPIDVTPKLAGMSLVAAAFDRGDVAMAAIAAVQMQFPDPPSLAKRAENPDEIARRARELSCRGLLKFWDPALHPRADSSNFHPSDGRGLAHRLRRPRAQRRSQRRPLTHNRTFLSRRDYRGSAHRRPTPTSPGKTARHKSPPAADALEMQRHARRMPRSLLSSRIRAIRSKVGEEWRRTSSLQEKVLGLKAGPSSISLLSMKQPGNGYAFKPLILSPTEQHRPRESKLPSREFERSTQTTNSG